MRRAQLLRATALSAALACSALYPAAAAAEDWAPDRSLGVFAGVGYLASPGTSGGAFWMGGRLGLGAHFAAGFDVGYGLLNAYPAVQDRWWVMPSAALVIPTGRLRWDIGGGFGVGTSSGYDSWSAYRAAPFGPVWHYTVPAARVHITAAFDLTHSWNVFARADAGTVFIGSAHDGAIDTTWGGLWLGVESRLF